MHLKEMMERYVHTQTPIPTMMPCLVEVLLLVKILLYVGAPYGNPDDVNDENNGGQGLH